MVCCHPVYKSTVPARLSPPCTPMNQNTDPPIAPEMFKAKFEAIAPLILEEWPTVSADKLTETAGNLDQVVDCIANATNRTRLLIQHQLGELVQLATLPTQRPRSTRLSERLTQLANGTLSESDLNHTITLLEERTEELLGQFKQEVLPELNEKVRNNMGGSLLTALGIGFILGLLLGGGRGR